MEGNNTEIILSIASLIVALVAIFTSVITWSKSNKINKSVTEKTFNQKFFEEIFFKYITIIIPEILIKFECGSSRSKLGCEELEQLTTEMLEKAIFYKFFDNNLYSKIYVVLTQIDEKLVEMLDPKLEERTYRIYKSDVILLVNDFYGVLKEYYQV